jgi:RNA polymerase sigma factor (sigma-70 family)
MDTALETGVKCSPRGGPAVKPLRLMSDEQLARRVADGDREAFTIVYDRHLPALVRYCRSILLVGADAEDAAQNAMIAALRSLPRRPPKLKLKAWLFRVAHNEAISLMRRRAAHEPLEHAVDVSSLDVADTAAVRESLRELLSDLQQLPERQRAALLLRELCDLGYGEIAGALECNEHTAMQTVFEARSNLMHFDAGRSMSCTGVQRMISDGDRRSLRARRVRAHMRSCDQCRTFAGSLPTRRAHLALLFPVGATKLGIGSLLATMGFVAGTRKDRVATLLLRFQGTGPGLRGAAASLLLAAGGVSAVAISHHAQALHRHLSPVQTITSATHDAVVGSSSQSRHANAIGTPSTTTAHGSVQTHVRPIPNVISQSESRGRLNQSAVQVGAQGTVSSPSAANQQAYGSHEGSAMSAGSDTGGIQVNAGATKLQLTTGTSSTVRVQAGNTSATLGTGTGSTSGSTTVSGAAAVAGNTSVTAAAAATVRQVLTVKCLLRCS